MRAAVNDIDDAAFKGWSVGGALSTKYLKSYGLPKTTRPKKFVASRSSAVIRVFHHPPSIGRCYSYHLRRRQYPPSTATVDTFESFDDIPTCARKLSVTGRFLRAFLELPLVLFFLWRIPMARRRHTSHPSGSEATRCGRDIRRNSRQHVDRP